MDILTTLYLIIGSDCVCLVLGAAMHAMSVAMHHWREKREYLEEHPDARALEFVQAVDKLEDAEDYLARCDAVLGNEPREPVKQLTENEIYWLDAADWRLFRWQDALKMFYQDAFDRFHYWLGEKRDDIILHTGNFQQKNTIRSKRAYRALKISEMFPNGKE